MIGVFDSGVGGLSALAPLKSLLPNADLLYYADTAALPLGEKSAEEIRARVWHALRFFERANVSGVLLACGTASSIFTEECKEKFSFPVIDIISPTAMTARSFAKGARVLLLATPAAITSAAFASALADRGHPVFSLPCPRFVRLAEKGGRGMRRDVEKTLFPALSLSPTAIVLGCTHFSLLKEEISAVFPKARILDAAACGAAACAARFSDSGTGQERFFATGDPAVFANRASKVLGREITVQRIQT